MRCRASGWPDASVRRGRSDRGRRHDLSILQAEFSLTQMLETPISGRIFLEQVIRDNLDIGRPDQVGLVFDPRPIRRCPRATPGRFRTRVITWVVADSLDAERAPVGGVADLPQRGQIRRLFPDPEIVGVGAGVTPSLHVDKHHDQAVREGPAHRDHHHRHQRFRDRETTDESARAAGDRRHRQPAPARRPTNRPRPDHRDPIPAHRHRTHHHRDRHPHPRPVPG